MAVGAPYKYTADQLNGLFEDYKIYFQSNVMYKPEMIKSGERCGEIVNVPTFAIPEKSEFCLFIDVARSTFDNWLSDECAENNPQLSYIATRINEYIRSYQTKSGISGLANPMLVARINGITETVNVNNNVQVQALPVATANNIIDLTDLDYEILDNKQILSIDSE